MFGWQQPSAKEAWIVDEHLTQEAAGQAVRLIETSRILIAEEYAEGRVREFMVLQRTMSIQMRADGYEEPLRERERPHRTLAWAVRVARRHQPITMREH